MRFRCRLTLFHKGFWGALAAAAALTAGPAALADIAADAVADNADGWAGFVAQSEPNLLLLRVILDGEEIAAAIDGEARGGVVYVNLAELAEALEEPPRPPLMAAVSRLSNYFPADFLVDLREQALFVAGHGETAIERRLQAEYDAARRRPSPEEYEELAAPVYRWVAAPFASFSHHALRRGGGGDVHNSVLLFGDFLKSDGRLAAWDGGAGSSGGASLDLWRDGGRFFISRNFDGGRISFTGRSAERTLLDEDVFWRLEGGATNAGLRQGGARFRGGWENGGWNGGLSLSDGGGDSIFGGINFRPSLDSDSRRSGFALRVSGDYAIRTAANESRQSRLAVRFTERLRLFSLSAETRRYRGRDSEQSVEINKRFRTVERPRLDLALRAAADFDGGKERSSRGQMTLRRRFFAGENRTLVNWRVGYGRIFAPDNAADFFTFSLGASAGALSGSAEWRRNYRAGRDELRLLVGGGERIAWTVDGFATDDGEWSAGLSFHHTWAFDSAAGRLRFSNELAGRGALAVCANTAVGKAVPEVRLRGRDRDIRLDKQSGCAFIPAAGRRLIALDKKSLPPRVKTERGGVIANTRLGRIAAVDFLLVISGEVTGVVRANGEPVPGIAVELVPRPGGDAVTARTAFDGGFFFFDVTPGDYLLRADGIEREITVGEDESVRADLDLR